ncbi:MAG: methyltransferase [Rhizobiales bacterium]|nr:methyltransferase [Hyphomicrobiales bacterium]
MNCAPMVAERTALETSEDAVLGGRLRLRQPLRGHRVGHDAILLAAATGANAGERAVDLGAGVGGAGLALAVRVGGLHVTLVEIDAMLCALAADNARLNRLDDRVRALPADAEDAQVLAAAGFKPASIDRVLMNPPFNDPRRQNVSPDPRRRLAHAGEPGLLPRWVAAAAFLLKPQGVLTLIWRAEALADVLGALAGEFGDVAVLPVLPRPEAAAIRVLVRAVRGGGAKRRDEPALILNDAEGRPTAAAEAVLRGGETLSLAR